MFLFAYAKKIVRGFFSIYTTSIKIRKRFHMIFTVTLNPSIDYFLKFDKTVLDDVNRINESRFVAAGKGINCSKMLDVLEIPSETVYFAGGRTGDFINESLKPYQYLTAHPIAIEGLTRINVKVYGSVDYAFNPTGPLIEEKRKQELLDYLSRLSSEDVVIISGSLPRGVDREYVKTMCRLISERGAKSVLDVPNFKVKDFEGLDVYLIKPNEDELKYMVDGENINKDNYKDYLKKIREAGVRNILLSMGKHGALYYGEYGIYHVDTPKVTLVKSIGAGDSMLGTFVATILRTNDIENSLRLASAASTSMVCCDGMPSADMISEMTKRITVTRIE